METLKKIYSQLGNEIQLIENGSGQYSDKTILIIGAVHGDEPQGKFLIENYLDTHIVKGKNRLLFVPCLNPDGLELNTRQNANEIDINRNFPTMNWVREPFASEYFGGEEAASEPETQFVMGIINSYAVDLILTFHAPYKVVNYDGPAQEFAEKISEIIGYPTENDIGYATPGSFGTYAGVERKLPIITLEVDEEIDVKELIEPANKIFEYLANC